MLHGLHPQLRDRRQYSCMGSLSYSHVGCAAGCSAAPVATCQPTHHKVALTRTAPQHWPGKRATSRRSQLSIGLPLSGHCQAMEAWPG